MNDINKKALSILFDFFTVAFLLVTFLIITVATISAYWAGNNYFVVRFPFGEHYAETILFPLICFMAFIFIGRKVKELINLKRKRDEKVTGNT